MGWGSVIGAIAGPVVGKLLGGSSSSETTTTTEIDPWTKANIDQWENLYLNSPVPQYDMDNLTAALNPWQIEQLGGLANWAQGGGADQVAMMNLMGMNQAGVGDSLQGLAGLQAGMGANFANQGGNWIMDQLNQIGSGNFDSVLGAGAGNYSTYNGGFQAPDASHLKFEYDQGTYDQIMNNLGGLAQGAFDAYSDQAKTDSLFNNGAGLQMGQALLGGANTKTGQQSALLDAMTNQDIINYGAEMNRWAGGLANQGAMTSGQSTLQAQTGAYQSQTSAAAQIASANINAAASRANAAMAAKANMFNSAMSGAGNMMGYGVGMMGDASNSLNAAGSVYGMAGDTFGNANTANIANMNTSLAAGDYLYNYDQAALDRYNSALIFNQSAPGEQALAGLNAMGGVPYGKTTTGTPSTMSQIGGWMGLGQQVGGIIGNLPIFGGSSGGGGAPPIGGGGGWSGGFSDIRLKKNIELIGEKHGVNIYKWDWNESAEMLGASSSPSVGVIAQEMLSTRPDVVSLDASGYLKVDYSKIPEVRGF